MPRAGIARKDGEQKNEFKPGRIPSPPNQEPQPVDPRQVPPPITYLQAVADVKSATAEESELNNFISLGLGQVSDELSSAAPAGRPDERVRLWMRKHEKFIRLEAKRQNISFSLIAGVIALEAIYYL